MNSKTSFGKFIFFAFCCSLLLLPQITSLKAQPTPTQALNGHDFSENYWDTMVFNNTYWDHPEVDPQKNWLNNTWNIKWIKEGNFEMGMLAFMNKTNMDQGVPNIWITPAQLFWMHYSLEGHEIWIADMLSAWYGYSDDDLSRDYTPGEEMTPFFYMSQTGPDMTNKVGIKSNPSAAATPLSRDNTTPGIITYSWAYNYSDIIFYVPRINHTGGEFEDIPGRGAWNYSDPGSYINGSTIIGNQTYIAYKYTLTLDSAAKTATLAVDYHYGAIGIMKWWNESDDTWLVTLPGQPNYMPENWSLCIGHWVFITTAIDTAYWLETPEGSEVNATSHTSGLSTVQTKVAGVRAFDFAFSSKPNYQIENITLPAIPTDIPSYPAVYEALDVNDNEFTNFVSGMTQLIGDFGRLITCYVINQTNNLLGGIPFDEAWEKFAPNETAALLVVGYPEYGQYHGGALTHDPIYIAYYESDQPIPAFPIILVGFATFLAVAAIISRKKQSISI